MIKIKIQHLGTLSQTKHVFNLVEDVILKDCSMEPRQKQLMIITELGQIYTLILWNPVSSLIFVFIPFSGGNYHYMKWWLWVDIWIVIAIVISMVIIWSGDGEWTLHGNQSS